MTCYHNTDIYGCINKCTSNVDCKAMVHSGTNNKCCLKNSIIPITQDNTSDLTSYLKISSYENPDYHNFTTLPSINNFIGYNDMSISGNDIPLSSPKPLTGRTAESCSMECNNNINCKGFIYDPIAKDCYLKDNLINVAKINGLQSYIKTDPSLPTGSYTNSLNLPQYFNSIYRGTTLLGNNRILSNKAINIPNVTVKTNTINNVQQCADLCTNSTECKAAVYDGLTKACVQFPVYPSVNNIINQNGSLTIIKP